VVRTLEGCEPGVYCGWASVGPCGPEAPRYKAAVSIGWNPSYVGEAAVKQKMVEPYLLHEFAEDFYGAPLRMVVTGWLRNEAKFEGEAWLEDLKASQTPGQTLARSRRRARARGGALSRSARSPPAGRDRRRRGADAGDAGRAGLGPLRRRGRLPPRPLTRIKAESVWTPFY
jgi:hypothetical protein